MKFLDILQEEALLLESGVRIPQGTKSAKILHHDDFDGVMSAVAMGLQLKKQGIPEDKITTGILHDRDEEYDQEVKLAKRKNQMLVVVDFDRFKNRKLADKNIDVQTDHHEAGDPDNKNTSSKSVGKTQYGSDVMHISSTKAQGFFTGTDLAIMNGIDSAKFGKEVSTNIYLQRELKKNDGVANKKMRLAIITSSILGQLVRSSGSVNPGAVKSIINNMIKSPSLLKFYTEVKKHVNLQKEQVQLLKAYEGKDNGEIDWEAINAYNEKAPKEMRIGVTKAGTLKKSEETGRKEAASEEELAKRNKEGQAERDLDVDEKGNKSLKSKDAGDADLPPWEAKDKFKPLGSMQKSKLWRDAEKEAAEKTGAKWDSMSAEEKKKKTVDIWKKSMNELQKGAPGILRKTENVSKQTDMKGNRYLAYEDQKIAANIRDFWQFWQMAMRPDYYDKYIQVAKAKNKDFKPEEIDLVDLGKKSLQMAKSELFTIEELKKRGFEDPAKVLGVLNKAFDVSYAKSGGHKAITNIDLKPIFGETFSKYDDAAKKAKNLAKGKEGETAERLKEIEKKMSAKAKQFSDLLRVFKERTQTLLTQAVQGRINRTKKSLQDILKEHILSNSGMELNESNTTRREWKRLAKEYGPKLATSIMLGNEKHEKVIIVKNPKEYATSNPKFIEALKKFYRMKDFNIDNITEKFYYYDKKVNEVCPGSWDD
jgi:hypothetical protein